MGAGDSASLGDFFDTYANEFNETSNFMSPMSVASSDDLFSMLEVLADQGTQVVSDLEFTLMESSSINHLKEAEHPPSNSSCTANLQEQAEIEAIKLPKSCKRQKISHPPVEDIINSSDHGQQKGVSHITVERNRRKQMNEHLIVLRSLMPCFYVKRGDQASIIGGVVDYITELQQVVQSLEAKKQRKVYSDHVLSPRLSPLVCPRKPPLSPCRPVLPISPRTPQPAVSSPNYRTTCRLQQQQQPPLAAANSSSSYIPPPSIEPSPASTTSSSTSNSDNINVSNRELLVHANSTSSSVADVEVKFSGSNLIVKTISSRFSGQTTKLVSVLEDLSLEILQAGISTVDETLVNSFTIKIGIECQLSVEDLVQHIQQTFC